MIYIHFLIISILLIFNTVIVFSQEASPTPKPFTVVKAESYIRFTSLVMENGDCKLHCWWGFEVGETDEVDWLNFLENQNLHFSFPDSPFGELGTIRGETRYFLPSHITLWDEKTTIASYFLKENILTGLQIDIGRPDRWFPSAKHLTITDILEQQETQVDVYYISNSSLEWDLLLSYPDQSFTIQYTFAPSSYERDDTGNITLCFGISQTEGITLNIENSDFSRPLFDKFQEILQSENSYYIPIEESNLFNSITKEDLIDKLIQSDGDCFVIEDED